MTMPTSMTQTTLFQVPSPEKPDRTARAGVRSGDALKEQGMRWAAENRKLYLETAQASAKFLARNGATITIDDVFAHWGTIGMKDGPQMLGNAAGSVFKGPEWEFCGFVKSTRPSNHGRHLMSWRLRGDK